MYYKHRFELPGRPGCVVFVQTPDEIKAARIFSQPIKTRWHVPKFFYHLRRGGHIAALEHHKRNIYFSRLDIKDFFGSITSNRVQRVLKSIGFALADAQTIAHRS